MKRIGRVILRLPVLFLVLFIGLYQRTLSPDHGVLKVFFPGGYCRYTPSCSEYAKLSVKKYGFFWGIVKSLGRVFRCAPWNDGGVDLP